MSFHYTKNTVEASAWCLRCNRVTMHRVDQGRIGPCLECCAKLDAAHKERSEVSPDPTGRQRGLWDEAS
jgi:hypothetical protein